MSLLQDDVRIVALTADKETERTYRPEAASLRERLFLADRGYDGHESSGDTSLRNGDGVANRAGSSRSSSAFWKRRCARTRRFSGTTVVAITCCTGASIAAPAVFPWRWPRAPRICWSRRASLRCCSRESITRCFDEPDKSPQRHLTEVPYMTPRDPM
jgi:hypothetical protein